MTSYAEVPIDAGHHSKQDEGGTHNRLLVSASPSKAGELFLERRILLEC